MTEFSPRIGITLGDPSGIGPEVSLKAFQEGSLLESVRPVLIGLPGAIEYYAEQFELRDSVQFLDHTPPADLASGKIYALPAGHISFQEIPLGQIHRASGEAALEAIRRGVALCLRGHLEALVTGPIHKKSAQLAGLPVAGHTEYLAELCGAGEVRLLLASERLRVIHVSTHTSLREACELVTRERVLKTIELGAEALRLLGSGRGRIAVAGLNPHASDEGLFGREEAEAIAPAVEEARKRKIVVEGPLSPDTVFHRAWAGEFDLVVAMYHDQGHIPMKLLGFREAVNITVGLPIIRTSVDHGTAFDIAGQNRADPENMRTAIRWAAQMARRRS